MTSLDMYRVNQRNSYAMIDFLFYSTFYQCNINYVRIIILFYEIRTVKL